MQCECATSAENPSSSAATFRLVSLVYVDLQAMCSFCSAPLPELISSTKITALGRRQILGVIHDHHCGIPTERPKHGVLLQEYDIRAATVVIVIIE